MVAEVTEGLRHNMDVQDDHIVEEVDKLREHYRQVHSSIGLYVHVSSRVTLLTVLLFIWGFHFLSIQTTGKQSCS